MNAAQTLNLTQTNIKKELRLLRSFVIGMAGKDTEGNYRPEFVQRILRLASERPTKTFKGATGFLRSLDKYSR